MRVVALVLLIAGCNDRALPAFVGLPAGDFGAADLRTSNAFDSMSPTLDLARPHEGLLSSPTVSWTGGPVAWQIDPLHRGAVAETLTPPLRRKWTVTLQSTVSYPVVAEGLVFVTVGGSLLALDEQTGSATWGPTSLSANAAVGAAAYDLGKIFVSDNTGAVHAYVANTGAPSWTIMLKGGGPCAAPTAFDGLVFVSGPDNGGARVYALDEVDGSLVWSQPMDGTGMNSSAAVSNDGVYLSQACVQAYAFQPKSGTPIWYHAGKCDGGGGATPVPAGNKIYARDTLDNTILDLVTGSTLGSFAAQTIPAFANARGFFLEPENQLTARDESGNPQWVFGGDGSLHSPPLVVGNTVFIGSGPMLPNPTGTLYAVDASSGTQLWTDYLGSPVLQSDDQWEAQTIVGLAAADGMLFVPAWKTLFAYSQ